MMNRSYLATLTLACTLLVFLPGRAFSEEKAEVLGTSPSGAFRVESAPAGPSAADQDSSGDVWVVSTKDPTQRAKLPKQSPDSPTDDEIHFSPNEQWIFGLRHVGSGLRYGNVYHLANALRIELAAKEAFNDSIWEQGVKLGALKHNYSADGVYAMTFFVAWSCDSSRLLIQLQGGEEKRAMQAGLLYFNTRTGKFEITDYLRQLHKRNSKALACAEPVDPLPDEADLKTRFDALDRLLNDKYTAVLKDGKRSGRLYEKRNATGSSTEMKEQSFMFHFLHPWKRSAVVFSSWAMLPPQGSTPRRRTGRIRNS